MYVTVNPRCIPVQTNEKKKSKTRIYSHAKGRNEENDWGSVSENKILPVELVLEIFFFDC